MKMVGLLKRLTVKGDEGAALITTLLIMGIMTLLGFAAIMLSQFDTKVAGNEKVAIEAQYAAESGLNDGQQYVNANSATIPDPTVNPTWQQALSDNMPNGYHYDAVIKFKFKAADPVFYNKIFYPSAGTAPATGGYPVLVITSTATKGGYKSILEMEVTRRIVPVNNSIKGGLTASGGVKTTGTIVISGIDHDENGVPISPVDPAKSLPGINAIGNIDAAGNSQAVMEGSPTKFVSDPTRPAYQGIWDALGFPNQADADEFLNGVKVYHGGTDVPDMTAEVGGAYYLQCSVGKSNPGVHWDINDLNGTGILIVHNPLFDPLNPGDPTPGHEPANLGIINGGTFKGVIIADKIDKIAGGFNLYGAMMSLTTAATDKDTVGAGSGNILYSAEAVSKYASGSGTSTIRLVWKKKTGYE